MRNQMLPLLVLLLLQFQCSHSLAGSPDPSLIDSLTFEINDPPIDTVPKPRPPVIRRHSPPPPPPSPPLPPLPSQTVEYNYDRYKATSAANTTTNPTNGDQICPGIVCFIIQRNGGSVLDCQTAAPWVEDNSIRMLECTFWQPPTTSLGPAFGGSSHGNDEPNGVSYAKSVRIRLRPPSVLGTAMQRESVDWAQKDALLRLCSAVRAHLKLSARSQLKLSLTMLQIRKLTHHDLSRLFSMAQVSDLILWNPEIWEETSLLDQPPGVVAVSSFIRLTVYCEVGNAEPAFTRLWIPWTRWQIKFRQCRGRYTCYPWPPGQPLCCSPERCTQLPHFVMTQKPRLSREATVSEQVLAHYTCEAEPRQADNALAELHFRQGCWTDTPPSPLPPPPPLTPPPEEPEIPVSPSTYNFPTVVSKTTTTPLARTSIKSTMKSEFSVPGSDSSTTPLTTESLLADVGLTDERTRMRRLIVGIICLLLLNLLLFFLFVTIGCYLRRRFRRRRKSSMACQIISASNASELVLDQVNPGQSNVKEVANGTAVGSKNAHSASKGFHNYQPEFIFPPVSLPIRSKEEQQLLQNGNPTAPDGEVCLPSRLPPPPPPAPRHSTLLQRLSLHVPWRRRGSTSRYKHTLVLEHPNDSLNVDWGIKNLHPL